jgi:hypothetical protein
MRVALLLLGLTVFARPWECLFAQGTVVSDAKLPFASIELKRNDPPATSTPWQLPKPGDPLYDAKKEAAIKNDKQSHLVHVFERGVFRGYARLTSGPPPEKPAKEMRDAFMPSSKLPADAVELSASARPDKSDYFPTRPKTHPANIPSDCIPVRVFHRGQFIGWSFLPRDAVAALHRPEKT